MSGSGGSKLDPRNNPGVRLDQNFEADSAVAARATEEVQKCPKDVQRPNLENLYEKFGLAASLGGLEVGTNTNTGGRYRRRRSYPDLGLGQYEA